MYSVGRLSNSLEAESTAFPTPCVVCAYSACMHAVELVESRNFLRAHAQAHGEKYDWPACESTFVNCSTNWISWGYHKNEKHFKSA